MKLSKSIMWRIQCRLANQFWGAEQAGRYDEADNLLSALTLVHDLAPHAERIAL